MFARRVDQCCSHGSRYRRPVASKHRQRLGRVVVGAKSDRVSHKPDCTTICKTQSRGSVEVGADLIGSVAEMGSCPRFLRQMCYICRMSEVAARELRNSTADVLRRVESGERVTITSRGRPVAELTPVRARRRKPISRGDLTRRLSDAQADSGLRDDLAALAGDTTDDLGPIR